MVNKPPLSLEEPYVKVYEEDHHDAWLHNYIYIQLDKMHINLNWRLLSYAAEP